MEAIQTGTEASLILVNRRNGVTTLIMNAPERLNGWTHGMMEALRIGK